MALISQIGVVWSFLADFIVLKSPIVGLQVLGAGIIIVLNIAAVMVKLREKN